MKVEIDELRPGRIDARAQAMLYGQRELAGGVGTGARRNRNRAPIMTLTHHEIQFRVPLAAVVAAVVVDEQYVVVLVEDRRGGIEAGRQRTDFDGQVIASRNRADLVPHRCARRRNLTAHRCGGAFRRKIIHLPERSRDFRVHQFARVQARRKCTHPEVTGQCRVRVTSR